MEGVGDREIKPRGEGAGHHVLRRGKYSIDSGGAAVPRTAPLDSPRRTLCMEPGVVYSSCALAGPRLCSAAPKQFPRRTRFLLRRHFDDATPATGTRRPSLRGESRKRCWNKTKRTSRKISRNSTNLLRN